MSKNIHYSIQDIDHEGANINLIWGERSNGKSYQVKHEKAVELYLKTKPRFISNYKDRESVIKEYQEKGNRFMLIRRWDSEMTSNFIESYFSDVDIYKLTNEKYNMVKKYRDEICFAYYDFETRKIKQGEKIGYAIPLSLEQNYAGWSFLDVTDMIFEEFMARGGRGTKGLYLRDEPNKLMNLYSTVDRKRGTTKMWLVGNTITRICPYVNDWGLGDILRKQKQGTIFTKWISTGDIDDDGNEIYVKLAIEHCKSTGRTSYVIGDHKNMLNKGEWQSDPQPKLPYSYKEYNCIFRIGFLYKGNKWLCEFLKYKYSYECVWFIKPYRGKIKDKTIWFSDCIMQSPYFQKDIYNPLIRNKRLRELFMTFKESNIFYSDDLSGTEFKQSIDFVIRK